MKKLILIATMLAMPAGLQAQNAENPFSYHARFMYAGVKLWLVAAAEKMPEEHYSFRPTPEVRSFGEIIGHAADVKYMFCSLASGEKPVRPNHEKTKTSKAELVAALKDAVAYCDRVYDGMTDAKGAEVVKLGPGMPRLGVLHVNSLHSTLHYGNLITYMRMKGVVPPSSDPAYMPQPPKR